MANIFQQAYEILSTKTVNQMTNEELKLVGLVTSFVANILPKIEPEYDNKPISAGLLRLAEMIEEAN